MNIDWRRVDWALAHPPEGSGRKPILPAEADCMTISEIALVLEDKAPIGHEEVTKGEAMALLRSGLKPKALMEVMKERRHG